MRCARARFREQRIMAFTCRRNSRRAHKSGGPIIPLSSRESATSLLQTFQRKILPPPSFRNFANRKVLIQPSSRVYSKPVERHFFVDPSRTRRFVTHALHERKSEREAVTESRESIARVYIRRVPIALVISRARAKF